MTCEASFGLFINPEIEKTMNPPINLSELESIINSLLAEGKCACHIINPHKTRILM
jgi:hypothetical protein